MSLLAATYGSDSDNSEDDVEETTTGGGVLGGLVAYVDEDAPPPAANTSAVTREDTRHHDGNGQNNGAVVEEGAAVKTASVQPLTGTGSHVGGLDSDKTLAHARSLLPARPQGEPSPQLVKSVQLLFQKKRDGMDLNQHLQGMRQFRNPSLYEKLIDAMDIDHIGSNCPPDVYDPSRWTDEDFFEQLALARSAAEARKAEARRNRTSVQFVSGSARHAPPVRLLPHSNPVAPAAHGSTVPVPVASAVPPPRRPSVDPAQVQAKRIEAERRVAAMLKAKQSGGGGPS
eukprot:m.188344 g.188344  ORF g.188344 m.188344 type:complete len:286 (+) comp17398_c0_seq1:89-946(+)